MAPRQIIILNASIAVKPVFANILVTHILVIMVGLVVIPNGKIVGLIVSIGLMINIAKLIEPSGAGRLEENETQSNIVS
jgi:hypothetical protein